MKNIELTSYNITGDSDFINTLFPIPYELDIQLQDLYKLALKGKKSSIKKFHRLIEKYPNVPMLKNYLSTVYQSMGNMEKANEVNTWIVAEHPDYLYGKLNLASKYIAENELDKVPEILGENLDLKTLYPERDTFHTNEFLTFFNVTVRYFSAKRDLDEARKRLEIMIEIDEDSAQVIDAEQHIFQATIQMASERAIKEEESRIHVEQNSLPKSTKSEAPNFTHNAINIFYEKDLIEITNEEISEILSLPHDTLISDLNLVLQDSIDRYNYFKKIEEREGWDENKFSFLSHALFFLSELKSEKSTDLILEVLSQNEAFLDFYLSDLLSEFVWSILYNTSTNNLDVLKEFMQKPNIYTFAKSAVVDSLIQIYYHQPNREEEVINWFIDILEFYNNCTPDDNILDSELLGLIMASIMDAKILELISISKELFDKNYVGIGVCGDYDEFISVLNGNEGVTDERILKSVTEIYDEVKEWNKDDYLSDEWRYDDDDDDDIDDGYFTVTEPIRTEPKIGRNDPCPCGSGKKYKKCCMNK